VSSGAFAQPDGVKLPLVARPPTVARSATVAEIVQCACAPWAGLCGLILAPRGSRSALSGAPGQTVREGEVGEFPRWVARTLDEAVYKFCAVVRRLGVRASEVSVQPDGVIDAAFRALYEREHAGQVRRAALLLGSTEQAQDVVHDAMVELYSRWDTIVQPGAYLNRAVLNRCRDAARRARVHRRSVFRMVDRAASPPPDDPLGDLFDGLPFNQRAVVILRFYAGCSVAETAEALGCPQGSVGPWLNRALATLREQLS
jgi:RNA polymerase sigma factor (sigma-70 family)